MRSRDKVKARHLYYGNTYDNQTWQDEDIQCEVLTKNYA